MSADNRRLIAPGSCTWCGHRPHTETCALKIVTKTMPTRDVTAPCPCTRHVWAAGRVTT